MMSSHDENVEALSYRYDCGERQTMSHLMTCGDAPNCTCTDLAMPTLAGVNCAKQLLLLTVAIENSKNEEHWMANCVSRMTKVLPLYNFTIS